MTPTKEDYLKSIYKLGGENTIVSNKQLANLLQIKAASVTEMVAHLVNDNLISYIPYKGVQLTDYGIKRARQLTRKHRLWEVFLVDILNFDWEEVHKEADRLEHASSDELIDRLDAFLNFPKTDPHGEMIPRKDGSISPSNVVALATLPQGTRFIVKQVADEENLLAYLSLHQIKIGDCYKLLSKHPDTHVVTIALDKQVKLDIKPEFAQKIFVNKI